VGGRCNISACALHGALEEKCEFRWNALFPGAVTGIKLEIDRVIILLRKGRLYYGSVVILENFFRLWNKIVVHSRPTR
jgi:hypothetical protein